MRRDIPDEIFVEIFSPALDVPDQLFSSHRYVSLLLEALDEPSSSILLVCKTWLRIATPLLYKVVILRSKGQAQALELALRSRPELGPFIKKLRIDGGYGVSMHTILQAVRNLTDICISLDFEEQGGTEGMCRGLSLISPVRLILAYYPAQFIVKTWILELMQTVVACIPEWNNLAVVEMPHDAPNGIADHNDMVAGALKAARNLRRLVLSAYENHLFRDGTIPHYIATIITNPSLREIRPKAPPRKPLSIEFAQVVQSNARLAGLFDLRRFGISSKPFVYPAQLVADSKLEDTIWDRVLFHLFQSIDPLGQVVSDMDENDPETGEPPVGSSYLRVCKRFAALPISTSTHILNRLGPCVLFLDGSRFNLPWGLLFEHIIARVPGLVEFNSYGCSLPPGIIEELAVNCGTTIQTLRAMIVGSMEETMDPSIFAQFPRMRSFTWDSKIAFNTAGLENVTNIFNELKDLSIVAVHPSFYTVMSRMQLPSLQTVRFNQDSVIIPHDPFLQTHGQKLKGLTVAPVHMANDADILSLCPSIKVLTFSWVTNEDNPLDISKWSGPHRSLERIVLDAAGSKEDRDTQLLDFLENFDHKLFPALKEIQHPAFDWTSVDEPPSAALVQWANEFIARNIHLVREKGGRWRPRRQYVDEDRDQSEPK